MEFIQPVSREQFGIKYMINGESSPEEVFLGVAKEIASVEKNPEFWEKVFFDSLVEGYLLPGGRILANARPDATLKQYNNCFVIPIEDSLQGIYKALAEDAAISGTGGGVGFNISKLRPKDYPTSKGGVSSGPISFLRVFNESAKIIQTGGARRAAHICVMNIDHPDIEEFITVKQGDTNEELKQFNLSVGITDAFINAVEKDLDWDLVFLGKVHKTVKARYLMDLLARNAFMHNEPGILNLDHVNKWNTGYWAFKIESTNPCVAGDTRVEIQIKDTLSKKTIKEVIDLLNVGSDPIFIKSFNESLGIAELKQIKWGDLTRKKAEVYRIADNQYGRYIICTGDHKILTARGWVEAKDLEPKDKIMSEFINQGYLSITKMDKTEDVYDINVEGNHNFYANGFVVHNCGEIPMPNYSLCCLSSLNLTKFVMNPFSKNVFFDFVKLREYIKIGVRFLDNVLDVTQYPLKEIEELSKKWRRIGLGFTGLGDAFAMMKMPYGGEASKEFSERLASEFQLAAYNASTELAVEKGPFPAIDKELYADGAFIQRTLPPSYIRNIRDKGIRNVACLTIAPTGTTSLTLGNNCSSGIEPIFSLSYTRNVRIGSGDETKEEVVHDYAYLKFKEMFPESETPDYFNTTLSIDPKDGIDIQAIFQKRWDHSISKTANLPKNYSFEQYKDLWLYAYKKGLKGFTTFNPQGSIRGVLEHDEVEVHEDPVVSIVRKDAPDRPKDLDCDIHVVNIKGQKYIVVVGKLGGSIYETFVTEFREEWIEPLSHSTTGIIRKISRGDYDIILKNGSDTLLVKGITKEFNHDYEGPTRLLSTALRHGTPLEFIVEQLSKSSSFGSWSKSLANVLKKYIKEGEKVKGSQSCPSCGSSNLIYKEGCIACADCSWTKCG